MEQKDKKAGIKNFCKEEVQVKIIFYGMILVLALVLLPLFRIAYYNFRSVDDFGYAVNGESVWNATHSVWKVLMAQISYTWDYYHEWQGTFFSEWFTTSIMGIFSENAYYMGTYFTLGGMVAAQLLAFMVIFRKVLGADVYRSGIASMSCICLQVLLTPAPAEAYFWFCGAMLYTFIYALGFLLLTLLVLLYFDKGQKKWKTILLEILTVLLSIAVSGSNYITALTMILVYCCAIVWYFYIKHPHRLLILVNTLVYFAGFLVNVLAPGNLERQRASGEETMPVFECIFSALKEAAIYIAGNTILPCIILGMLLLPLFVHIVSRKKYRYPFPGLVSFFTYGLFAAQFTPTLFALGIIGAGRVQNLYRFTLYILLFGNELYWTGWFMHRHGYGMGTEAETEQKIAEDQKTEKNQKTAKDQKTEITEHAEKEACRTINDPVEGNSRKQGKKGSYLLCSWLVGGMILCASLTVWGGKTVTSYSAMQSLRRGEAKAYCQENENRMEILRDKNKTDAEIAPFSVKPYVLYFGDIDKNPEDWVNKSVADYFHKNSVRFCQ